MNIKLLIAHHQEVIRLGLAALLEGTPIHVVAQTDSSKECLKLAQEQKPDVILLDLTMPDHDGLGTLKKLRQKVPDSKVVILTHDDNPTHVAAAIVWGASDYLLLGSKREAIVGAITKAAAGESPTQFGELRRVAEIMKNRLVMEDEQVRLTSRQTQVLRHVALGLGNKEIAQSLEISVETVKEHVQNILRKLEFKDRTQAAVWAIHRGLT